jgi:hypothetical protein
MRIPFTLLLCALCLSRSSAAQLETVTVPLVDKTGPASPFQVNGKFLLQEAVHGNQLEWSWGQKVAVKNVTGTPILLFVTTLSEIGRYPKGQHAAPGDGPTYVIEDDRFFSENLIQPGESVTLRDTEPGAPNVACCINPLAEKSDPIAEYYLLFVQFADGSTFGDPAEARDALAIRETILRGLRELVQSYTRHGEQAFLTEMKQQPPWSGTSIFAQIWTTYKEKGIDAAVKRAQQILAVAGSHEASIRQASSNPAAGGKPFPH